MDRVIDREASDHRAVYDHETEPGDKGRRIADWGGDDLFHGAPPRRRFRGHAQPRSLAARRAAEREEAAAPVLERRPSGPAAPVRRAPAPVQPAPVADFALELAEPATPDHELRDGRRTVTITGHPGALATTPRRRPARTVEERIGSRPDRVAAWAFGMGIGLILIAVSTADAAPL
jgi:hypothetical protein